MGKRDRKYKPARGPARREKMPVILVVSEGDVTEPQYLKGLRRACKNPRVKIKVESVSGKTHKATKTATEMKKQRKNRLKKNKMIISNMIRSGVFSMSMTKTNPS
jgi:hypothetical protein